MEDRPTPETKGEVPSAAAEKSVLAKEMRWCPWSSTRLLQLHGKEVSQARRAAKAQLRRVTRQRTNPKSQRPAAARAFVIERWCCCRRARRSGHCQSKGSMTMFPSAVQQNWQVMLDVEQAEVRRSAPSPSESSRKTDPAAAPALVGGEAKGLSAALPRWEAGSSQRSLSVAHSTLRRESELTASPWAAD